MNRYSGKCKMCGNCCKLIPIVNFKIIDEWKEWLSKYKVSQAKEPLTKNDLDLIFIAQNFVEITDKKELKKRMLANGWDVSIKRDTSKYYECIKQVDNKCTVHKERPYICAGYPNYLKHKDSECTLINQLNCGYKLKK